MEKKGQTFSLWDNIKIVAREYGPTMLAYGGYMAVSVALLLTTGIPVPPELVSVFAGGVASSVGTAFGIGAAVSFGISLFKHRFNPFDNINPKNPQFLNALCRKANDLKLDTKIPDSLSFGAHDAHQVEGPSSTNIIKSTEKKSTDLSKSRGGGSNFSTHLP